MATENLDIVINAVDKATAKIRNVTEAINDAAKAALRQSTMIDKAFAGMAGVISKASTPVKKFKTDFDTVGEAISNSMQGMGKQQAIINDAFVKMGNVMAKASTQAKKLDKTTKKISQRFMGLAFSLLFTGMALNKFFSKAISSAVNAYKIVGTENSIFSQKTNELSAAWEFFKFSLIDALSQSELFVYLIDLVIQVVQWLGQLNPTTLAFIAGGLGFGFVVTKIAEVLGSLLLLGISLDAIGLISLDGLLLALKNIALHPFTSISQLLGWLQKIVVLSFTKLIAGLKSFSAWAATAQGSLVLIPLLIVSMIYLFAVLYNKVGSIGGAFFKMGYVVGNVLNIIGAGIIEAVLTPLREMIKLINIAINAWNVMAKTSIGSKLGMSEIGRIAQPDIGLGIPELIQTKLNSAYDAQFPQGEKSAGSAFSDTNAQIADAIRTGLSGLTVLLDQETGKITPQN